MTIHNIGKVTNLLITVLLYLGVFMLSYLFFMYRLFPYNTFEEFLAGHITRQTGAGVQIGSGNIGFPLRLNLTRLKIDKDNISFPLETAKLTISPLPLISGKPEGTLIITEEKGGTISAFFKKEDSLHMELDSSGFTLEKIPLGYNGSPPLLTGKLNVEALADWKSNFIKGSCTFKASMTDTKLNELNKLPLPIPISQLQLGTIDIQGTLSNGLARISRISVDGQAVRIQGKGTVTLRTNLQDSLMSISGVITHDSDSVLREYLEIAGAGNKEIKFILGGTMKRPRLRINGIPIALF